MDDTGINSCHGLLPVRHLRSRIAAIQPKSTQARVRLHRDRWRICGRGGRQPVVGGKRLNLSYLFVDIYLILIFICNFCR